ncbi:hypothetical protein ACLB2K_006585 [Fragaria x ananassa]
MGFGHVHNFRCGKLNLSLCEILLNNFDVKNQKIQIHGRHMSIIEKDFDRLIGLRCHSTEVNIHYLTAKCEAVEWNKRLCRNDTYINLKSLKKTIVYTDDDDLFMVSFALFSLATMFYPSTPGYIDPRFLIPLKNPSAIRSHNWGQFAYTKLVEGVTSYQSGNLSPNLGCLVFLQVFYLSVLGEMMFIVSRLLRGVYPKKPLKKTIEEVIAQIRPGKDIGLVRKPIGMMFGSVANISLKERELLRYLFSKKEVLRTSLEDIYLVIRVYSREHFNRS